MIFPFLFLYEIDFNPLPPHGGRPVFYFYILDTFCSFQSTPSAWRETFEGNLEEFEAKVFQSTPSAWRETPFFIIFLPYPLKFQSTPSAWRETLRIAWYICMDAQFQSTPSAWRETRIVQNSLVPEIHFNPLPPHGGRRENCTGNEMDTTFQSTPSAWRETSCRKQHIHWQTYFNPLPPHGGRLLVFLYILIHRYFNPLPPHGGRRSQLNNAAGRKEFQSTPSAWRETAKLHRKAFFISPILVQSCKKGCKRLHSAPEKMVFFEKREKNLVRNLQHLSVRL